MPYVEMTDLQKLLSLLILKTAPQDLSYSLHYTVRLAVVYIFSGLIVLQTTLAPDDILAGMMLGLAIQYMFTYSVLRGLNRSARMMQTFSAILGVGILFNLMSWPIFAVLSDEMATETMKSSMSLLFLLLISWEVLVKAHIFKHALEMKMFSALALSLSLFFISVALSQLMFPGNSTG